MPVERLTQLQYSDDRSGLCRLYVFEHDGFHSGAKWFNQHDRSGEMDMEPKDAYIVAGVAIMRGKEVRITDGGDMLIFHARDGKVLYPADVEQFWIDVGTVRATAPRSAGDPRGRTEQSDLRVRAWVGK